MTELKVAVMIYGAEDLSKQLNEWKTFVEANSKFKLKITEIHEAELTKIKLWKKPIYEEDCYFAHRTNVNIYDAIPKTNHIITLLWKLLEGQNTCLGGGAWGGDLGIHDRPYTSVPYNVWWWDESYTDEGFNTHGAQIITHEFQNALRWMLEHEYGWLCPIDPYAGGCDGMTLAECYKAIFSAIPQSVYDQIKQHDKIPVSEFIGKLKQTRIREIDIDTLSSCISGWFLGGEDSHVFYEERGWQITIVPKTPSATILHNWVEQEYIETKIADKVLQDIAKVPPPISYKQPISTEAIMIYSRAIEEHIKATNEFPSVKKQFREMLDKGYELRICACQLSYAILRPLTHWIETPTFVDPFSEWYYYAQEGIYWELEKCTTKECVEKYLDDFWANMKKLNAQLPNVKTPAIIISSPVTLSAKIQIFDGEWVTVGENIKNLTIKICEAGETHIKFYSVKHPDWAEDTELTEMINVVGEISYNFDPSNIPRKHITIKSIPPDAKITITKV